MMKEFNKVLWGFVFILLGLIIGTNTLGFTNINIFFDGWWTLFLIIPAFIGLISNEKKTSSFLLFVLGIFLLFDARDVISLATIFQLIFPFLLILLGFSFIFNQSVKKDFTKKISDESKEFGDKIIATFAEVKVDKENKEYKGGEVDAIFGSTLLDIRGANLGKSTMIRSCATFGRVTILVPDDVKVEVKAYPIFGSVNNIVNNKDSKKVIYIDATATFGEVNIR